MYIIFHNLSKDTVPRELDLHSYVVVGFMDLNHTTWEKLQEKLKLVGSVIFPVSQTVSWNEGSGLCDCCRATLYRTTGYKPSSSALHQTRFLAETDFTNTNMILMRSDYTKHQYAFKKKGSLASALTLYPTFPSCLLVARIYVTIQWHLEKVPMDKIFS